MSFKYIIGIDEAGRGPLAGPVAVGVAIVPVDFDWDVLVGVNDSKKLSPKKRAALFGLTEKLKQEGQLNYSVVMVSASDIDSVGIVPSIKKALEDALQAVAGDLLPEQLHIKLDGGLKAPAYFVNQTTIIKGDASEKVIGLASIMAKVTRDQYMERIAKEEDFLNYSFEVHKGYGTKMHRDAISKHGLSKEHRVSFCRNIVTNSHPRK